MRCPHCAAHTPEGSRFCGICGRPIAELPAGQLAPDELAAAPASAVGAPTAPHPPSAGSGRAAAGPAQPATQASVSLFELPVSRGARWARILAILALDAVLAGAGIAMIVSYLHARERARAAPPRASAAGMAEVEVLAPVPAKAPPGPSTGEQTGGQAAEPQAEPAPGNPRSAPARGPGDPGDNRTPGSRQARSRAAGGKEQPARSGQAPASSTAAAPSTVAAGAVQDEAAGEQPAARPANRDEIQRLTREVALLVNRNTAQLQRCYHQAARATASDPDHPIAGRLEIHVEIAVSGRATNVHPIENTTGSEPLARCVTSLFESWTYPQPPGNESLELVWPIQFKAPK